MIAETEVSFSPAKHLCQLCIDKRTLLQALQAFVLGADFVLFLIVSW